jgi:hypothetical protein
MALLNSVLIVNSFLYTDNRILQVHHTIYVMRAGAAQSHLLICYLAPYYL